MQTPPKLIPELKVQDFKKSLDFYCNMCGFEILYDRPEANFAMLGREGAQIMIEELTNDSRMHKVDVLEYPFGRGMHFQIQVSDVDTLYKNFKDKNYPIFLEMEDKWYRKNKTEVGNKQFRVQDPDGYLLRFFTDLGTRS